MLLSWLNADRDISIFHSMCFVVYIMILLLYIQSYVEISMPNKIVPVELSIVSFAWAFVACPSQRSIRCCFCLVYLSFYINFPCAVCGSYLSLCSRALPCVVLRFIFYCRLAVSLLLQCVVLMCPVKSVKTAATRSHSSWKLV